MTNTNTNSQNSMQRNGVQMHPLSNRKPGFDCELTINEQSRLSLTNRQETTYWILVAKGEIECGSDNRSILDTHQRASPGAKLYTAQLTGNVLHNWRFISA